MKHHERRLQSCEEIVKEHLDKLKYSEIESFRDLLDDLVYPATSSADDIASDLRRASLALTRPMAFKNAGKLIVEDVSERVVIVPDEVRSHVRVHINELCRLHTQTIYSVLLLLESVDKLTFNKDVLKGLGADDEVIAKLVNRRSLVPRRFQ